MSDSYRMLLTARNAALGVLALVVLLILGSMSHADAVMEDRLYCAQVARGEWPAYRSDEVDCTDPAVAP